MGSLRRLPPDPWPTLGGWMDASNSSDKGRAVIYRSMHDVGVVEVPLGSNRGVRIDRYVRRGGGALGSYWCAFWAGAIYADCGLKIPRDHGACDSWLPFLKADHQPRPGDIILYGPSLQDAQHIGIVARVSPVLLTIEGNRGLRGGRTRNGVAVQIDEPTRSDILGYCPLESFL